MNVRLILFRFAVTPVLLILYWFISSDGLRRVIPYTGTRLYKVPLPGLSYLEDFEAFYRLEISHVFVVFLLWAVWKSWVMILRLFLLGSQTFQARYVDTRVPVKPHVYMNILICVGCVLLLFDALLFFQGLSAKTTLWGNPQSKPFFVPLIATVLYIAMLLFLAFHEVNLELRYDRSVEFTPVLFERKSS